MDNSYTTLFWEWNRKSTAFLAVGFLLVNLALQYMFCGDYFLSPNANGDENGYTFLVAGIENFDLRFFSRTNAQPFIFMAYLFNLVFDDARFSVRFTSLAVCSLSLGFVCWYYLKYKFTHFVQGSATLNKFIAVSILFAVYFILSLQYSGASDGFSMAFAIPGLLLLTQVLLYGKRHNLILIGFLLAISFTSRPTFLLMMLGFLFSLLLFFPKRVFSKKLIATGLVFCLFTGLINIVPVLESKRIVLDVKEIPKEVGTSWFEMNYLMAKKWDSGELPNTQWLSSTDVMQYKKENPDFVFPKNMFEVAISEPGLFFRQLLRMTGISMYSSLRYLYFLFPFLLVYPLVKRKDADPADTRKVYFTVGLYFITLFIFMCYVLKLMEFRWMQLCLVLYAFYALDFSKGITPQRRILLFNAVFLAGILFFILKMLK